MGRKSGSNGLMMIDSLNRAEREVAESRQGKTNLNSTRSLGIYLVLPFLSLLRRQSILLRSFIHSLRDTTNREIC